MTREAERALRHARSRARAQEWALVLAATGLQARVDRDREGFALLLPEAQLERARRALEAWERENPPGEEPVAETGPPPDRSPGSQAGALVAAGLLLFYLVTGPRQAESPWFRAGSAEAGAVVSGEVARTVTALTLHADAPHVLANAVMGALLFNAVCRALGGGVGLAAILLAGAAGNGINALFQAPQHSSVGASTAVFGALGLLCGRALARRRRGGARGRRGWAPLAAGLGLIAMLGVGGARTDLWAHLFGFLAGLGLGLPLARLDPARLGLRTQLACGALALVLLLGSWAVALGV